MATSFITAAEASEIKAARADMFATAKMLGNTVTLTFYRDQNEDANADAIGPQEVLIVMAAREATVSGGQASAVVGLEGEFRKEAPFDVQRGDRFTIPNGPSGHVTGPPIDSGAFIRATFTLEG